VSSLAEELEEAAAGRFVRWDAALWNQVVNGPARSLIEGLAGEGQAAAPIVQSYLRLACEGIGLGYLIPGESGAANVFTLAFLELLPRLLPAVPPGERPDALARCWNLGENLEAAPVWLRRLFYRRCQHLARLADLPGLVESIGREATVPPSGRLEPSTARAVWIHLGTEDRRFVPGPIHYVAPRVACIHDKHRSTPGARSVPSLGVWLAEPALVLGPMGCDVVLAAGQQTTGQSAPAWSVAQVEADPRAGGVSSSATNGHSAIVALQRSQMVVALLAPEPKRAES
jgi:hypothetical protein